MGPYLGVSSDGGGAVLIYPQLRLLLGLFLLRLACGRALVVVRLLARRAFVPRFEDQQPAVGRRRFCLDLFVAAPLPEALLPLLLFFDLGFQRRQLFVHVFLFAVLAPPAVFAVVVDLPFARRTTRGGAATLLCERPLGSRAGGCSELERRLRREPQRRCELVERERRHLKHGFVRHEVNAADVAGKRFRRQTLHLKEGGSLSFVKYACVLVCASPRGATR